LIKKIDEFLLKVRPSKIAKIIKRQEKILEQPEGQCWEEFEVIKPKERKYGK